MSRVFLIRLLLSQLAVSTCLLSSHTLTAKDLTGFCNAIKQAGPEDGVVSHIETKAQHCRVTTQVRPATLSRSAGSFIEVYTWLPAPDKWNGRFIAFGSGGYSDSIAQSAMTAFLNKGFAVGATNTGHRGDDLSFASDVPERIDYWGRYAVHALSETGKTLIEHVYGDAPQFSYFSGCSTGGHQALASVQYFPQDFDGVLAGAPGNNRIALNAAFLWLFQQFHDKQTGEAVITKPDLALLSRTVARQCGEESGPAKGVILRTESCKPDLTVLQCQNDRDTQCLSADKLSRLQKIYQGPVDPVTGEQIYPGFPPGSEYTGGAGWAAYMADPKNPLQPARADFWRLWAFDQAEWDPWTFDWHTDYQRASNALSPRIDATETDLSAFMQQGGKLIIYHGLADPVVSSADTARYFREAAADTGASFNARYYEVPGMSHCAGGPFISEFDAFPALQQWVEHGTEPGVIHAPVNGKSKETFQLAPAKTILK